MKLQFACSLEAGAKPRMLVGALQGMPDVGMSANITGYLTPVPPFCVPLTAII